MKKNPAPAGEEQEGQMIPAARDESIYSCMAFLSGVEGSRDALWGELCLGGLRPHRTADEEVGR